MNVRECEEEKDITNQLYINVSSLNINTHHIV